MALINPFHIDQHKIYKSNFLDTVSLKICYTPLSFENLTEKLKTFLKSNFNVDFNPEAEKSLASININSTNKSIYYVFKLDHVEIKIDAKFYISFQKTILPVLSIISEYFKLLNEPVFSIISLKKRNIWKLNIEDIINNRLEAIQFTFREPELLEIGNLPINKEEYPIKLSRQGNISLGDGNLTSEFNCVFSERNKMEMGLLLKAEATNIQCRDLTSSLTTLNDAIYGAFHQMVSENVLSIMSS